MHASDSLLAQTVTRNAFVSLVLSGPVVGAPGADNLKIRPEFFPGGVGFLGCELVFGQKFINDFTKLVFSGLPEVLQNL